MQQSNTKIIAIFCLSISIVLNVSANAKTLYFDINLSVDTILPKTDKIINKVSTNEIYNNKVNSIEQTINYYANQYQIQPELLKAIIKQESNFNTLAVSPKGAKGLMQVMPSTALGYGNYNLLIPKHNIEVGTRHLSYLLRRYENLPLALAAYNAGEGNVDKYRGIPPFSETQNYVLKVLQSYNTELDKRLLIVDGYVNEKNNSSQYSPQVKNSAVINDKQVLVNEVPVKKNSVLYFTMSD